VTFVNKREVEKGQVSLAALALEFLKIGAAGFGGGMAIIALMEHELVKKRRVIESDEFAHGVALSPPWRVPAEYFRSPVAILKTAFGQG
jgi:hypothetical protein